MLRVFCGCSAVAMEIDNGADKVTETSGAECEICQANDGDYDKSPHRKEEHVPREVPNVGNVIVFPSSTDSNKTKRREERKALKRHLTGRQ